MNRSWFLSKFSQLRLNLILRGLQHIKFQLRTCWVYLIILSPLGVGVGRLIRYLPPTTSTRTHPPSTIHSRILPCNQLSSLRLLFFLIVPPSGYLAYHLFEYDRLIIRNFSKIFVIIYISELILCSLTFIVAVYHSPNDWAHV